ncbi:MAG: DUF4368 domain-containing protein [Lachnospiraceae bacterium]|nr:DUF4368 domain-containing protein [Lachnospiraceae bacterium]
MYEKYKDSLISRDEYLDKKRKCDLEMKEYQDLLKNERANEERNKNNEERKNVDELVQKYKNIDKLTSEIEDAFIERIDVYSPDRIKITWKFARVFEE